MAFSGTFHRYNVLFLLLIATGGALVATALMFNLSETSPLHHNKDILTDGEGTYISAQGIQLASPTSMWTSSSAVYNQTRAGRATYAKLFHLWDAASGQLADFTTSFSFVMDSDGGRHYGDGLSFFLAQNTSLVIASGAMGLPVFSDASNPLLAPVASSPFVAVEFDTYWNRNWDPVDGKDLPIGNHVGININSLISVKAKKWLSNIAYGKECVVKIQYDSASQNLSVTFTGFQKSTTVPSQFEIHYTVDLRRALPEWVLFGFSASSSGDNFQKNCIKSWFFNGSDLHVDQNTWRKDNNRRLEELFVALLYAMLICLWLAFGFFLFFKRNKRADDERNPIAHVHLPVTYESCSPRPFAFEELLLATNNFDDERKLGDGGFGAVYRAVLPDGKHVAVKRVSKTSQQGIKEYKAEVNIISRLSHRHLVQLIGWCHEIEGELLVVSELMENRSLDVRLFNSEMVPLAWDLRYRITLGLAKALHYLHEECAQCVLHRDIKSSNVMLDSRFDTKLGDFGLAKLVDHDKSLEISVLAGTRGYLAPECFLSCKVSRESDVYSYGVVALEIATGRKAIDTSAQVDQVSLVNWVRDLHTRDRILEAADPKLGDDYDELQMKGLMVLGLWCVHHDFRQRPLIQEVVRALNNTQDPLSDLHGRIPTLVSERPTPLSFASILQTPPKSSTSIIPMGMEMPSPTDLPVAPLPGNTILAEPEVRVYPPLLWWPHILILHPLSYLLAIPCPRSPRNR